VTLQKYKLEDIIKQNNKLIYSICNKYSNYMDKEDLYQVGVIGLINAYNNYDFSKNVKFSTYAFPYIVGEVSRYIRENKVLKISRDLVRLGRKINEYIDKPNENEIYNICEWESKQIIPVIYKSNYKTNYKCYINYIGDSAPAIYNETNKEIEFKTNGEVIITIVADVDGEVKGKAIVNGVPEKQLIKDKVIKCERSAFINEQYELKVLKNKLSYNNLSKIKFYLIGSYEHKALYKNLSEKSKGTLFCVNKHKMIADNFECEYPLNAFMKEKHIDYNKGLIFNNIDTNVFYLGFGKVNKELFINSVCNNQFLSFVPNKFNPDEYEVIYKPVNYYIFDKSLEYANEQNLNYTFYRFENEYLSGLNENKYYDILNLPANYSVNNINPNDGYSGLEINVDSKEFYNCIKEKVESIKSSKDIIKVNYIIVSLGDDITNIDNAKKIEQKIREWTLHEHSIVKIFVRIKDSNLKNMLYDSTNYLYSKHIIPFGSDDDILNIELILNKNLETLALKRHMIYSKNSSNSTKVEKNVKKIADLYGDLLLENDSFEKYNEINSLNTWYNKWSQYQRDSNYYAVLNLKFKLKMIGIEYDLTSNLNVKKFNELIFDFYNRYNFPKGFNGSKVSRHESLSVQNLRRNMAIQEHQRWNAFMICHGIIPPTLSDINMQPTKIKDYLNPRRKHANITTIEGLNKYMKNMGYISEKISLNNKFGIKLNEYENKLEILKYLSKINNKNSDISTQIDEIEKEISNLYNQIRSNIVQNPKILDINLDGEPDERKLTYYSNDVFKYDFDLLDEFVSSIWDLSNFKDYIYISCDKENDVSKLLMEKLDKLNIKYIFKPNTITKEANLNNIFIKAIKNSAYYIRVLSEDCKELDMETSYALYYNKDGMILKLDKNINATKELESFKEKIIEIVDNNIIDDSINLTQLKKYIL